MTFSFIRKKFCFSHDPSSDKIFFKNGIFMHSRTSRALFVVGFGNFWFEKKLFVDNFLVYYKS